MPEEDVERNYRLAAEGERDARTREAVGERRDDDVGRHAQILGRSSGAVANCMTRRAKAGDLKQVSDKPRRYEAVAVASRAK